ncbi:MAG: hypothetical protein ABIR81_11925 [Ginsengibacter sp.]
MTCSKKVDSPPLKPRLLITLKDTARQSVAGATVTLYKNSNDPGITNISDSTGIVIFDSLEVALYYWVAQKDCKTNWNSQTTLKRVLVPDVILYGYSVLSETGTLKIINNSIDTYKVVDSFYKSSITLSKDTPYIGHPETGKHIIHSEKVSTPGVGKDTVVDIKCGDTSVINLPL